MLAIFEHQQLSFFNRDQQTGVCNAYWRKKNENYFKMHHMGTTKLLFQQNNIIF